MESPSTFKRLAASTLLLCMATGSSAITLGRLQGTAFVGRPLNVSMQVVLDPDSDRTALCLESDVFFGDSRLDASRVSTRLESVTGVNAIVRVTSQAALDEPVVTLLLRLGCNQKVSRRYVLLAEPVDPLAESTALPGQPSKSVGAATTNPTRVPSVDSTVLQPLPPRRPAPGQPSTARPSTGSGQVTATAAATAATQRGAVVASPGRTPSRSEMPGRARLKLDPLDLSSERELSLKISSALSPNPDVSPQQRAEAAALWQALSAGPEEIVRNLQRFQALETDTRNLRDAVQANNTSLIDLRGQLEESQRQRGGNGWLLALLVAALATPAALYARRRGLFRMRPGHEWWRSGASASMPDVEADPATRKPSPMASHSVATEEPVDLDLSLTEAKVYSLQPRSSAMPVKAAIQAVASDDGNGHHNGQRASLRSVRAEELHDVQQQADFFVSLGEYPQAIDVLLAHINAHPDTSPLPWLDLLDIYHTLDRRHDYEAVCDEFHGVFNAQVPAFDSYRADGHSLDTYPGALSRIVSLWPSPEALDVIEDSMLRKPGQDSSHAFSLEAYRELLLLHGVGKDIIDGRLAPVESDPLFASHALDPTISMVQPVPGSASGASRKRFNPDATVREMPYLNVDIDLDAMPEMLVHSHSPSHSAVLAAPSAHLNLLDLDRPHVPYRKLISKKPRR